MVLNRSLACLKLLQKCKVNPGANFKQQIRHSGEWLYRTGAIPSKKNVIIAECMGAFVWWWILYHAISEPGHLIGEFEYPDPSKWTDEELGIPPDNA